MRNILLGTAAVLSVFIAFSPTRAHAELPTIRMCTGLAGLNYVWAGQEIARQAKGILNIEIVTSKGSLDNIRKLTSHNGAPAECDVGIIQSDAVNAADQAGNLELNKTLYTEYLHVICNTDSKITRITQLNTNTHILLGDSGGGAETTWASMVKADPKRYGDVPHEPIGGTRAAGIVEQGDKASCMLVVAGLNTKGIQAINESAKNAGNLRLIPANDGDILKMKDARGHQVYTNDTIPSGTYPGGLQPSSVFGSSVDTISVKATIVANADFIDAHGSEYTDFLKAVDNSIPSIKAHVKPQ